MTFWHICRVKIQAMSFDYAVGLTLGSASHDLIIPFNLA